MFARIWTKNNTCYASIVENKRVNGKTVQSTVAYIGAIDPSSAPYLKAAFAKKNQRPSLLYLDGTRYDPK